MTAAAALCVAFISVFVDPWPFGPVVLGHPSWGVLAFPAAFLILGASMGAIIVGAGREPDRGRRAGP